MKTRSLIRTVIITALTATSSTTLAEDPNPVEPDPGPAEPLQTRPESDDDALVLEGWTANILGVSGAGKTLLVVNGQDGYKTTAVVAGAQETKMNPAVFELSDQDHRIDVKVQDKRGAEWAETVDVPRGMKVTIEILARYEHRGFEGTIKNDTLVCGGRARRHLRFEIFKDGARVGNGINLEPGKSAHGVRLKPGVYELKVFEKRGADHALLKTTKLEPTASQWRYAEGCN